MSVRDTRSSRLHAGQRRGAWADDDAISKHVEIVVISLAGCRILKAATSPPGTPWIWTIAYGDREPAHGYEATREGAMQAFARSWHSET
jgi:hypothetical protein